MSSESFGLSFRIDSRLDYITTKNMHSKILCIKSLSPKSVTIRLQSTRTEINKREQDTRQDTIDLCTYMLPHDNRNTIYLLRTYLVGT